MAFLTLLADPIGQKIYALCQTLFNKRNDGIVPLFESSPEIQAVAALYGISKRGNVSIYALRLSDSSSLAYRITDERSGEYFTILSDGTGAGELLTTQEITPAAFLLERLGSMQIIPVGFFGFMADGSIRDTLKNPV